MDILFELYVTDLLQATRTQFKSDREQASDSVNILALKFTPSFNRKTLLCVARTKSTNSPNTYITKIELQNMEFSDSISNTEAQIQQNTEDTDNDDTINTNNVSNTETSDDLVEITCSDNRKVKIKPQVDVKCNIRLNCNCLDFFQRMASYNKSAKVLIGRKKPTHYQSPTTPANKERGNPNNSPGMCKHTLALYYRLVEMGIIKEF